MNYRLEDLIDIEQFQSLQDRLSQIYSFPSAIINNNGRILTATEWQDICTKFHRKNPECEKECIKSDQYILEHLAEANPAVSYRCPHGLIDNAAPIVINGHHLGNFFTGQFFLQKPDMEFYRDRAAKYGFDEHDYLEAVRRVPIWSKQQVDNYLFFIKGLIEVIASIGLKNLKAIEAGKRLEESEKRHRSIIQTAMDGFCMTDREGRILQVNDAYCRMSGYSAQELTAMKISDVEINHKPDEITSRIQQLVDQHQARFETRHQRKDGSQYDLEVSAQYQEIGEGVIVAFLRDITEQKRTEEALRSRDAFISKILESVDEGFIVVDRKFRVLSANRTFCRLAKQHENDIIGQPCYKVSHHSDRPCFENGEDCAVKYTFDTGLPHSVTHTHPHADGINKYFEIKSYPLTDSDGRIVSVIETINDITEKKRLEDQLNQAQKMEAVGTLAGGVAHDFNNILTAIIGYASILKMESNPDDPRMGRIHEILAASERAAALTQSLLAFSRKQAINLKPVELNQIVNDVQNLLQRVMGEDIDLKVRLAKKNLVVLADSGQIGQVLMNLAANARDAMLQGGAFIITTGEATPEEHAIAAAECDPLGKSSRCAVISVSDTGCGIDEQTMKKIFEPFFTTKELGKGTGLGLAIAYGIVKQHGGTIHVDSEPGKGTTFRIYLPLNAGECKTDPQERMEPPRRGIETILLAEDEESVRKLLQRTLERFGYRVIAAGDGQEAIDLFAVHASEIELAVLDVIMPKKSGKEVYDSVWALKPDLDVLFMSGYTADIIGQRGIPEQDIKLVAKPLNPYDLLRKIRDILDKKQHNIGH